MRSSSQKDFSVYDFNEVEEAVEAASGKFKAKLESKRSNIDEAINNYTFLQAFTSGLNFKQAEVTEVSPIILHEKDNARVSYAVDTAEKNLAFIEEESDFDEITESMPDYHEHGHASQDEFETGSFARGDSLVMGASSPVSELPSDGTPVDVISDDEESSKSDSRSPSSSASDLSETNGLLERSVLYCASFGETFDNNMGVIVSSDYVLYGKTVYGESLLTFFSDCIKIECFDASGNDEKFVLECAIADIIRIDCRWSGSGEFGFVKLCSRASAIATEKAHDDTDIVKLLFVVTDIQWLEKEQKIKSLAARYRDIWSIDANDALLFEDDVVEPNMFYTKHCFTDIVEPFEDIIYPEGDPDAVSISKRDIELLQPDTFINDTIIDFYIKYMKNKIQPDEKHRFHFFNSFFFRKLADLDKDPGSALEGRAAFLRVRKWTRKVNLFEKDYIFVPVNFNLHWSLLVICHPGEITSLKDVDIKEAPKVPCILHMDSIKGSHIGLKSLIQSYLWEEWKERHPESPEDISLKFSNLRFVPLELPQQENSFDCGLFLLHYVELFLEESPTCFNPFKITKFSSFLTAHWFSPAEASLKRSLIRTLIYDLINEPSQKSAPSTCSFGHLSSGYPENYIKQESVVEFPPENCSAAKIVLDDSACSISDSRIEIKLLSTSLGVAQCDKREGLILREFLSTGETAVSLPECRDHHSQPNANFQKLNCTSCPIEECADKTEQLVSSSPNKDDRRPSEVSPHTQICSTSYSPKGDGAYGTPRSSMQEKEEEIGVDSSTESNIDHVVCNPKDETEEPCFLLENSGYVPDSPTLSNGEKPGDSVEDYREIAEVGDCKDSQEVDTTGAEGDDGGEDCQEITATTKSDGGEDYDNIETREADGGVNGEERPEIDTTREAGGGGDGECQEIDGSDAGGGGGGSQGSSLPLTSSQDIAAASDDEKSLDKSDVRMRRDEPGAGKEQQPSKRRKVMRPEGGGRGGRRRTRNSAKKCHP